MHTQISDFYRCKSEEKLLKVYTCIRAQSLEVYYLYVDQLRKLRYRICKFLRNQFENKANVVTGNVRTVTTAEESFRLLVEVQRSIKYERSQTNYPGAQFLFLSYTLARFFSPLVFAVSQGCLYRHSISLLCYARIGWHRCISREREGERKKSRFKYSLIFSAMG